MSKNFNYSDQIDAYFNQAMNEGDMRLFEQQLATDPLLKAEFDLQHDIVHSLKETRRVELKGRLNNLPTPGAGIISTPLQYALGTLLVAGITFSGYLFWEDSPTQDHLVDLTNAKEVVLNQETLPEQPRVRINLDEISTTEEETAVTLAEAPRDEKKDTDLAVNATPTAKETKVTEADPAIVMPDLVEDTDVMEEPLEPSNIELPNSGLITMKDEMASKVEIEHISADKEAFHYRFFNSKLYLYGSFGDMPYEILEINSKGGKTYYLFHNNSYFRLNANQVDITPLQAISNKRIIHELDIVRDNK